MSDTIYGPVSFDIFFYLIYLSKWFYIYAKCYKFNQVIQFIYNR